MPKTARPALVPDSACVREFLTDVIDRDAIHLLAGNPKGKKTGSFRGQVFRDPDSALEWVEDQQAKGMNIYWAVNPPSPKHRQKAERHELQWLEFVHLDLDMPKDIKQGERDAWLDDALERVHSCRRIAGKPSAWVSGNGVQAVWKLAKPLRASADTIAAVELVNRRLMAEFDAPTGTHDATRVLRVPGTVNYPGKAKVARGWKAVASELDFVSRDEFTLADFEALPPARQAGQLSTKHYIDFTREHRYSPNYDPWRWEDVRAEEPELEADIAETLDGSTHDRSAAMWALLNRLVEFVCRKERCDAQHLMDDRDTYRCLMEIVLEAAQVSEPIETAMGHVWDHDQGLRKLGYDVQRVIEQQADEGRGATAKNLAQAETRRAVAATNAKDEEDVTADEARAAFIAHVKSCTPLEDLPNAAWSSPEKIALRQPATESNVRMILGNAGIVVRLDVMADQRRYVVLESAGREHREAGAPARNWRIATRAAHRDTRSAAEESLIIDTFAAFGMVQRRDVVALLELIARENRYHPIEDYATAVPWDGKRRIKDVAACLESDHPLKVRYVEIFFRQAVAAVKSLRNYLAGGNGEQLSSCVTLVGPQGIGKTTFWQRVTPEGMLAKGTALRLGTAKETDSKREVLSGLVAILDEVGASLDRSGIEELKNFQTATYDEFRVAWAVHPISKPRMTQFCATSNNLQLYDQTGSRRFLAMDVSAIYFGDLDEIDLQQCYAEAWHDVMVRGEKWWLDGREDEVRARQNERHRVVGEEESAILDYLASETPQHEYRWLSATQICAALRLRYSARNWQPIKLLLEREGVVYRESVPDRGQMLRRVFSMPILPEVYNALRA